MNEIKNIEQIPISTCPLCNEGNLSIVLGSKKLLIFKNPDTILCSKCKAVAFLSQDGQRFRYKSLPSPYAYFIYYYSRWITPDDASLLAKAIRTNSKSVLNYLPPAKKHAWNIRIIVDGTGDADTNSVQINYSWEEEPSSKEEAKREIARIVQIQKEVRHVKREMGMEMKEIRNTYGRKKENQAAKTAALAPYENTTLIADQLLVQLDRVKLNIQNWSDDQY